MCGMGGNQETKWRREYMKIGKRKMVFAEHKWCLFEDDRELRIQSVCFYIVHMRDGDMCHLKRERVTN
jgi:hypothetical protein